MVPLGANELGSLGAELLWDGPVPLQVSIPLC